MMALLSDISIIALLLAGIWQFNLPERAKLGNLCAAAALLTAFGLVLYRHGMIDVEIVAISLVAGATAGYVLARVADMIEVPAVIAFQHGAGGVAAFLISFIELSRAGQDLPLVNEISGILGLIIGSTTFSGSMIASARLAGKMRETPRFLPRHDFLVGLNVVAVGGCAIAVFFVPGDIAIFIYLIEMITGTSLGILLALRIGGADMPVLISSLNATAGLAAAFCGMVIENQLLIAFGATVSASGSILTYVMCNAMNRRFVSVIFPPSRAKSIALPESKKEQFAELPPVPGKPQKKAASELHLEAVDVIRAAKSMIIIPGYGMAVAQAQQIVAHLASELTAQGKEIQFAIHPVAGRMPGHMNVLLAEAGIEYDMLVELDDINPLFKQTDAVLVVGACDVINPAAVKAEGTPISGMPILLAYQARRIICCNIDRRPGYSGVANSLYEEGNTLLLEGNAKETVGHLLEALAGAREQPIAGQGNISNAIEKAVNILKTAKTIIVIPGYGTALAKAQFKLVELVSLLRNNGATVKYTIHPVAGRMPGHMNVLLAEAGVDYQDLLEIDEANALLAETEAAIIVGACDVVNPAANESTGTPISGMPVLLAQQAGHVIVCNHDDKPGYSGVPNPLFGAKNTVMLAGDALTTVTRLINRVANPDDIGL